MTFIKEKYWENRNAGKRGQGELEKGTFTESETSNYVQVGTRLMPANRSTSRRKVVDHKFTTKGHRVTNEEESLAIRARVKRTELGEQQRIATMEANASENN